MITIFTIPKPFKDNIAIIQKNAIKSWTQLRPKCQIILFGDEDGIAGVAKELDIIHIPDITCNEYGTPLVADMFRKAQQLAVNDILCFANADIILTSDFIKAIQDVSESQDKFLMSGYRYNLDVNYQIDFGKDWENNILERVLKESVLFGGNDYFVFKRGILSDIPPFAIGRPGWDNWMIYNACMRKIPVIDCTKSIKAIHQNHNYNHLKNIENRFGNGPEAQQNIKLAGDYGKYFNLTDADWILINNKLVPATSNRLLKPFRIIKRKLRIPETYSKLYKMYRDISGKRIQHKSL